jgi:hypothetical protein
MTRGGKEKRMTGTQLDEALALSLDRILENLGREVYKPRIGALPLTPFEYISAAREWLDDQRESLCAILWKDPRVAGFLRAQTSYKIAELTLVVIDILRTAFAEPTCGWAAVYLVRSGLSELCPDRLDGGHTSAKGPDDGTPGASSPAKN